MAKLLISCDDYIFRHKGRYYFKNQEWYNFYQRYLKVFEALRIVNRVIDEDKLKDGRVLVEDPRIEIRYVPIFHGPKQYAGQYMKVGKAIADATVGCDAAVVRLPSTIGQRVAKAVMKQGIPYAVEVVFDANDGVSSADSMVEKLLWKKIDYDMRRTCKYADGVSCVTSRYLQKRYYSEKDGHFTSNYSTLDLNKSFFTSPRRYPDKKVFTIAHVSNQISLKGRKAAGEVIQAIGLVKKKGVIVNVEFAGDDWDNSTQKFKEYAKPFGVEEQIKCVGFLSRTQMSEFLDNADLFVVPTKAEGLPRIIIEAVAKGLPVITTPVSGNPELIPEHFLVDYYDIETLSERIIELVSDKDVYEAASRENFQTSLGYEGSLLEARRTEFYKNLKQRCRQ